MRKVKTNRKPWLILPIYLAGWVIIMSIMPGAKWILKSIYYSTPFLYKQLAIKGILLIGIFTYLFWVFWNVCEDLNTLCYDSESEYGARKPTNNFLWVFFFSALTLGIYGIYWAWQQGERLHETAVYYYKVDIKEDGSRCLIYAILGYISCGLLNFIFIMTLLRNMNRVAVAYNRGSKYQKEEEERVRRWTTGETGESVVMVKTSSEEMRKEKTPQIGSIKLLTGLYAGSVIPFAAHTEVIVGSSSNQAQILMEDEGIEKKHFGVCYNSEKETYTVMNYSDTGLITKNGIVIPKATPIQIKRGTILIIVNGKYEFLLQ